MGDMLPDDTVLAVEFLQQNVIAPEIGKVLQDELQILLFQELVIGGSVLQQQSAVTREIDVDDLNGRIAFASLKGPMDASLRATIHGLPVSIEMSAGEIIQGRTVPFNLDAAIAPGALKAQFSGSLNGLDDALRLRGRLTAEGKNLADLARAVGGRAVPAALGRPFGLIGKIDFSFRQPLQ